MRLIIVNTTVLVFFFCFVSVAQKLDFETVQVKTFLVQFENKTEVEAKLYFENDFVLQFQWEPEGLYLITRISTEKQQVYKVTEQLNLTGKYNIEDPKTRILPKRMFNKF